ncbi:hypothetical protein [Rhodococcus erythropolis]
MIPTSGSRAGETEPQIGVVIEDYADTVIDNSELGRDRAPVLRWAIVLDDGRLFSPPRTVPSLPEPFRLIAESQDAGAVRAEYQ